MTETTTTDTTRGLPVMQEQSADSDGCGCGCGGCGAAEAGSALTPTMTNSTDQENPMTTHSYAVSGMTCGHCAGAVTSELKSLDGVTDVQVELVAGGTSTVTVTSTQPLAETQVAAALDEAGDYQLA
ncbi:heavy-metal-associated domain-containing protein [Nocardioides taihuensis]|jgi:copper chaperone|uniref:Heavy-metal-associated domain-containing protein n=1 Tax=Nocardioides taihuensis TaxID=1835606 RepID=A0ABW0BDQ2_9ACTN